MALTVCALISLRVLPRRRSLVPARMAPHGAVQSLCWSAILRLTSPDVPWPLPCLIRHFRVVPRSSPAPFLASPRGFPASRLGQGSPSVIRVKSEKPGPATGQASFLVSCSKVPEKSVQHVAVLRTGCASSCLNQSFRAYIPVVLLSTKPVFPLALQTLQKLYSGVRFSPAPHSKTLVSEG